MHSKTKTVSIFAKINVTGKNESVSKRALFVKVYHGLATLQEERSVSEISAHSLRFCN